MTTQILLLVSLALIILPGGLLIARIVESIRFRKLKKAMSEYEDNLRKQRLARSLHFED